MKRVILFCALICATLITFSQTDSATVSNAEIARIISANQALNEQAGITNPDLIYTGQFLSYVFEDGTLFNHIVEENENQWVIVKKIKAMEKIHGPVVPPTFPGPDVNPNPKETLVVTTASNAGIPWWVWPIVVSAILCFLIYLYFKNKRNKEANVDPITSGIPMREGGITDANALAYANEVAARQFNIPNLQVTNIVRGVMNGTNVAVYYRDQATPQRRTFTNVAAYRGELMVNGQPQFVYFLQGCGNDVRIGNYFAGENIVFVADPVQSETLQTANRPVQQETTAISTTTSEMNLVELVKALVGPLKDKKNGKLIFTAPGDVKVEMSFSEILLVNTNHIASPVVIKDSIATS